MILRELENLVSRFSLTLGAAVHNLASTGRTKKQCVSIGVDVILVIVSLWLAYSLRLGKPFLEFEPNLHLFILLPIITVLLMAGLGVYKWIIRYSNERLTMTFVKCGIFSSFALMILMFLWPTEAVAPRSLFAIYGLLFTSLVIFSRYVWRVQFGSNRIEQSGERVAVYGAGQSGQQLVELMKLDESKNPVVFIDDDERLYNSTLAGLPVINGAEKNLAVRLQGLGISRIVLAMPAAKGHQYASLVNKLSELEIPIQTMPTIGEIMSGKASLDQVRDLSIDDLLGRSVVEPDVALMKKCITGKTVLVTGGGGSIGAEICRQAALFKPKTLIVLDQSEENLYRISEEIHSYKGCNTTFAFVPVLGSVTNKKKLEWLFKSYQIDTVYHAAAYKHVPIVEQFPEEAIDVNIFGTMAVLNNAIKHNVSNFTLISTDKAVRPANYMGATKRIAEMLLQSKADQQHNTVICMVRFGNVLGSSGSVLPKFKQQISDGGPVTITHKDITRYFMTIPEAAQLVMQASAMAKGGEVFVLDMGDPVKIYDFAISMIKLAGKSVLDKATGKGEIEIVEIGLRPGEKMYEELFLSSETVSTPVKKIMVSVEPPAGWKGLESLIQESNKNEERKQRAMLEILDNVKTHENACLTRESA